MTDFDRAPAEHPLPHEHARRRRQHLLAEIASVDRAGRFRLRRRGHGPYRRWLVPSIAAVGLGIAGMGTAAGLTDWWTEADPPVRPDEVAELLDRADAVTHTGAIDIGGENARTVARAPGAAIVAAPASDGYCFVRVPDRSEARLSACFVADSPGFSFSSWIQRDGEQAWYLYGRAPQEGAARLELFEQITRPLDESGPERLPDSPLAVDLGPGGFFLVRVPGALWASLDLAYGQVSVLDENNAVIERKCRYLGASPLSPLAGVYVLGGGPRGVLDAGGHDADPCPATGSYVDDALLRLAPPRSAEIGPFTGRDVVSGKWIRLSSFYGRPLVVAIAQPATETGMRFLRELSTFARRHPETHVVVVVEGSQTSALESEEVSLVDAVTSLETPIPVLTGDFPWPLDRHLVVALDPTGRARAELRPPRNDLYMFEVVTQDLLDELLSRAAGG